MYLAPTSCYGLARLIRPSAFTGSDAPPAYLRDLEESLQEGRERGFRYPRLVLERAAGSIRGIAGGPRRHAGRPPRWRVIGTTRLSRSSARGRGQG